MVTDYYKLPLRLGAMTRKEEHVKCALKDSIDQMLHLIITSQNGECKHDESFGFELWENDFVTITNSQSFKDLLKKSLQRTIEGHELRLTRLRVDIQLDQVEYRIQRVRTKTRIGISVNGTIAKTNELYSFKEQFFIGPLSYY